jgi:integrase
MANATINGYRALLLALWNHAHRKRRVSDPPGYVQKFKVPKRIPEAWSVEDMNLILQTAGQVRGRVCGVPAGDWWTALILVLYETGLRINAAISIAIADLNLESRWLFVPAENQKQDADQSFRLHPNTIAVIQRTLVAPYDQREELFPWRFDQGGTTRVLGKHYRKILKQAGLPHGRRDLFHKFRRTSATAVARVADEQAAKQHLGHSHLDVTRRYIDPRQLNNRRTIGEQIERPELRILTDNENAAAE